MSMLKASIGTGADWSALNSASRNEGVQRKALERADRGGKGLGIEELKTDRAQLHQRTGFDAQGSAELRKRLDADADGSVSGAELEAGKALVPPPKDTMEFVQRRLQADSEARHTGTVFEQIDGDRSGGLTKQEFVAAGPTRRPGVEDPTPESAKTIGGSADAAHAELAKVFDAADRNGDGSLGKDEFLRLKAEAKSAAAEMLGVSEDSESLTFAAGAQAYRKDRFDLEAVANTLAESARSA